EMFFLIGFSDQPAGMGHVCVGDLMYCTPKYLEALPMLRIMTGSHDNMDVERALMTSLLQLIDEDGLFYVPTVEKETTPWRIRPGYPVAEEPSAGPYGNARLMMALMNYYTLNPDPRLWDLIGRMARGLRKTAIIRDDYAFYPEGRVGIEYSYLKDTGYVHDEEPLAPDEGAEGSTLAYHGGQLRALSRWYEMSGDEEA